MHRNNAQNFYTFKMQIQNKKEKSAIHRSLTTMSMKWRAYGIAVIRETPSDQFN
jgi:hypothetical protein